MTGSGGESGEDVVAVAVRTESGVMVGVFDVKASVTTGGVSATVIVAVAGVPAVVPSNGVTVTETMSPRTVFVEAGSVSEG